MGEIVFETLSSAEAVADRAREVFLRVAGAALQERGGCYVALAGGTSPRALYRLFAEDPSHLDWSRVHLFVSDDRVVPADDDRSNSGMVQRELLTNSAVAGSHWFPVDATEGADAAAVAAAYEQAIRKVVPAAAEGLPVFDLVMLGMGSDRHTASLFPGKPALDEVERLVVESPPGVLPPPVERVTFTFPLLNAARQVLFLSVGADKAEAIAEVRRQLAEAPSRAHTPAARVRAEHGTVTWLIDEAAAMPQPA